MAKQPRRRGRPPKNTSEQFIAQGQLIANMMADAKIEYVNPDKLIGRKGFAIYREMRHDDQVKACLWFKKTLITARKWDIVPFDDSDEAKKQAEFVSTALRNIKRKKLKTIMSDMLKAFEFGFSVGEIIWEIDDRGDGLKLYLKDVKSRDPEYVSISADKHGNIKEFVQRPGFFPQNEIKIDPDKILHYAYQKEFSNHYGTSDLRGVYRAWWSKKFVTQFWNVFLERFGSPLMMMKYPQGAAEKLKAALKKIMTSLSNRSEIMVPEGVGVELIEATRAGTARYEEALAYYDIRIATGMLVPALFGMGTDIKRGADSQSRLHLRTIMKVIEQIGEELADEVGDKLIEPLVNSNFANSPGLPHFVYTDYGEFDAIELVNAAKELFSAGLLDADQADVNVLRAFLSLPIRDEGNEDEIKRSDPPPMGNAPTDPNAAAGGAQTGNDRAKKGESQKKTDKTGKAK